MNPTKYIDQDKQRIALGQSPLPGMSYALWDKCPWGELMCDPSKGYAFYDDFLVFPVHASTAAAAVDGPLGQYDAYLAQGGSIAGADAMGGAITLSSDGDNECVGLSSAVAPIKINLTTGKPCWFEARIKTSTIADTKHGFFLGLIEAAALAAAVPITAAGAIADKNLIGFHRLEGDGDYLDIVYKADGQVAQTVKEDAALLVADTWIKVGFYFDGSTITFFVNGVALEDTVSKTDLAAATFPSDVGLGVVLAILNATGTAPGNSSIDWWAFAQMR